MSLPTTQQAPPGRSSWIGPIFLAALVASGMIYLVLAGDRRPDRRYQEPDLAQGARNYLQQHQVAPLSEPLSRLLTDAEASLVPTQSHILLRQAGPAFELEATSENQLSLAKQTAKGPVVLVFYFGYRCNHCVSQLFALQQDIDRFHELGAEVVALSADPPQQTRDRFKKYGAFRFPVLSDPANQTARAYGVARRTSSGEDVLQHGTFVIDRRGVVRWCQCGDEPFTDNRTLLYELARAENRLPTKEPK
jgi:peroxiredoxin